MNALTDSLGYISSVPTTVILLLLHLLAACVSATLVIYAVAKLALMKWVRPEHTGSNKHVHTLCSNSPGNCRFMIRTIREQDLARPKQKVQTFRNQQGFVRRHTRSFFTNCYCLLFPRTLTSQLKQKAKEL